MRRGQIETTSLIFILFEVTLALSVGAVLQTYFLKPLDENTLFTKTAIVTDLALQLDTILAVPSNGRFTYQHDSVSKFDYRFAGDVAVVDSVKGPLGKKSFFLDPKRTTIAPGMSKPTSITLHKHNGELRIIPTSPLEGTLLLGRTRCPTLPSRMKFIIDAGHGGLPGNPNGVDTGITHGGLSEADITRRIVAEGGFGGFAMTRSATIDQYLTADARERAITQSRSILVSIHAGNRQSADLKQVVAYIDGTAEHASTSASLACHILDELIQTKAVTSTAIVPIAPTVLDRDDTRRILSTGSGGVYLEVGSMATPEEAITLARNTGTLGTGIRRILEAAR
ncbi:N-acetylmuramoyl-L-alanine amidase [Candidatus Woesearchaeota archaeon]|nr:N-acetylmuramoyl-L-alanine amidase [Candidatus Woesearchaeota archaeon]